MQIKENSMTQEEMRKEFNELYDMMAMSHDVRNMQTFGNVHKQMMDWMISNRPQDAQEWISQLESVRWCNYLTQKEADKIVSEMKPSAPWTREQWKAAMEKHGYGLEKEPYYNSCALYTTMNMIMSDSSDTLSKYVDGDNLFKVVYGLAVDKLTDADGKFCIRKYFDV